MTKELYIDGFHIYMDKIKDPSCKVGDIVVIDKLDTIRFDVIDYKDNWEVFKDNYHHGDLYGLITEVTQRESDNNYYINGQLLNFSVKESPVSMMQLRPYTADKHITYGSESGTSAMFTKISKPNAKKLKAAYPSWFV